MSPNANPTTKELARSVVICVIGLKQILAEEAHVFADASGTPFPEESGSSNKWFLSLLDAILESLQHVLLLLNDEQACIKCPMEFHRCLEIISSKLKIIISSCNELPSSLPGGFLDHVWALDSYLERNNDFYNDLEEVAEVTTECLGYILNPDDRADTEIECAYANRVLDFLSSLQRALHAEINEAAVDPARETDLPTVKLMTETDTKDIESKIPKLLHSSASSIERSFCQLILKHGDHHDPQPVRLPRLLRGFLPISIQHAWYLPERNPCRSILTLLRSLESVLSKDCRLAMRPLLIYLDRIGCALMDIGRYEEAMQAWAFVISVCGKKSYVDGPDCDLTRLVRNTGVCHYLLGNFREALICFEEALSYCQVLEDRFPVIWKCASCFILDCISASLCCLKEYEQSYDVVSQALHRSKPLVTDRFSPERSRSYHQLSSILFSMGQTDRAMEAERCSLYALSAIVESPTGPAVVDFLTGIEHVLQGLSSVDKTPNTTLSVLEAKSRSVECAEALTNAKWGLVLIRAATCYLKEGKVQQGLDVLARGVDILLCLSAKESDELNLLFSISMAMALYAAQLQHVQGNVALWEGMVKVTARVMQKDRRATMDYSKVVLHLCGCLYRDGRSEEAAAILEASHDVFEEATAYDPRGAAFLARRHLDMASAYYDMKLLDDCVYHARVSVDMYQRAGTSFAAGGDDLEVMVEQVNAVYLLSKALGDLGYDREALQLATEAVQLCSCLCDTYGTENAVDIGFAHTLLNLSSSLRVAGRIEEAEDRVKCAVDIWRDRFRGETDRSPLMLVIAILFRCVVLRDLNRTTEARNAISEASDLLTKLYGKASEDAVHQRFLIPTFRVASDLLHDLGFQDKSLVIIDEAVQMSQSFVDKYPEEIIFHARLMSHSAISFVRRGLRKEAIAAATESAELFHNLNSVMTRGYFDVTGEYNCVKNLLHELQSDAVIQDHASTSEGQLEDLSFSFARSQIW